MYNIMNFYQSVSPEKKKFFSKIFGKSGFLGNYPSIFTLSGQSCATKIIFLNLDYI